MSINEIQVHKKTLCRGHRNACNTRGDIMDTAWPSPMYSLTMSEICSICAASDRISFSGMESGLFTSRQSGSCFAHHCDYILHCFFLSREENGFGFFRSEIYVCVCEFQLLHTSVTHYMYILASYPIGRMRDLKPCQIRRS